MELEDAIVVNQTLEWLNANQAVYFVTVTKTTGSSPRPVGSIMAISSNDAFVGSVSSGCIEDLLRERLLSEADQIQFPAVFSYGGSKDEADRLQLPCGAVVELVIERISGNSDKKNFEVLKSALDKSGTILRVLDLENGNIDVSHPENADFFEYSSGKIKRLFGPTWQLLLIGAGDISHYLTQMAEALNYKITICEPRTEHAKSWALNASLLDTRMPDDLIRELAGINRCAIIALTHDPRLDDMAMLEALQSDAFYVGALGSKKNNEARKERLRSLGVGERNIERFHGPVGLGIGSKTPAEIAIAIVAELIAVRNSSSVKENKF